MDLLQTACDDLRNANKFKDLLNVILMMGNFMNGSNYGGGAYGFKIGSINRVSPERLWGTHADDCAAGRYKVIQRLESAALPRAHDIAALS